MTTFPINDTKSSLKVEVTDKMIELSGISKSYSFIDQAGINNEKDSGKLLALKDVGFSLRKGEILGVIGRNGAGKTTLLNIVAGTLNPTQGKVNVNGKVMGLFNLGVGFQDALSGRENIFLNGAILGASRKELEDKFSAIIEFSELGDFIGMPLGTYSQGMRLRLGFSIIANLDFDILVVDEVLAVGDTLFQNKCFQKIMDFRRSAKTLIITTQSMDLIERLCDKALILDHGSMVFLGNVLEGINKYRMILNTEAFFVGPRHRSAELIEDTKKWADSPSEWGQSLGTKEVIIERVRFINKLGFSSTSITSKERFKVKVNFIARDHVLEPHFGVAIFREDGVYCYGPNTVFDGFVILELRKGRGYFILEFNQLFLAPGKYRISIAIWDKNETIAFDYRYGYYELLVKGYNNSNCELLNTPYRVDGQFSISHLFRPINKKAIDFNLTNSDYGNLIDNANIKLQSVKLTSIRRIEKNVFLSGQPLQIFIQFDELKLLGKGHCLWIGLYRDDGIYCQGINLIIGQKKSFNVNFPKLLLLPGKYKICMGIWNNSTSKFLMFKKDISSFRVVFTRKDHGTIFLEHKWGWRLPE